MAVFNLQEGLDFAEQTRFEGEVPGEVLTNAPGSNPMERPPAHADAEDFLDRVLTSITQPKQARSLIAMLDAGIPLDTVASNLMSNLIGEGAISPQGGIVAMPSITIMLMRMAEGAGVDFKLSDDGKFDEVTDTEMFAAQLKETNKNVDKAQKMGELSVDELKKLPSTEEGVMTRPEELA